MRILHTSDWHLGRLFHGVSLLDDQADMVERVAEVASDQQVDAVIVAGDVFDRSIPPAEAEELFGHALRSLRALGAEVIVISGNHDSAQRLGSHDGLYEGMTLRGDTTRLREPYVIGSGSEGVVIYPIPFLDPAICGRSLRPEGIDVRAAHGSVTAWATDIVRSDLARRGTVRSVVVAHTFLTGGETSESERELSIGHVDAVQTASFRGFDYVALGHLHGPQQFDGGRMAYSGSPLPYSFSEQDHRKSVRIVDLHPSGTDPNAPVSGERIDLAVGRPLATITGPLDQLLSDPAFATAEGSRVRARLTDPILPRQAMARLQARFPHAATLLHEPPTRPAPSPRTVGRRAATIPPIELALEFWADKVGETPTDAQRRVLTDALAAGADQP